MHGFIGCFRACDRSVTKTAGNFLGVFECRGETLAGLPDFFSGHIGSGRHQGPGIFSKAAHVVGGGVFIFAHILGPFLFDCVFLCQILGDGGVAWIRQIGHFQN
jgi:hypothetical protein